MNAELLRGLVARLQAADAGLIGAAEHHRAIKDAIAALSVAQGQGFVMVPRVPTPEMVHFLATGLESRRTVGEIYAAMLAAAPAQPDGVE